MIEFSGNVSEANQGALWCWSRDGQNITLDISFQMSVDENKIYKLFKSHEQQWEGIQGRLAHTVIKNTTTKFNTLDFFTDRTYIKQEIFEALGEAFEEKNDGAVVIRSFQLRKVMIPTAFENEIRQKLIQQQKVKTAQHMVEVNLQTKKMALANKEADMVIQEMQGEVIRDTNMNELINMQNLDKQQSVRLMKAVQKFCSSNTMTTPTQILKMFQLWLMRTKTSKLKLLQIKNPSLLINTKEMDATTAEQLRPINVTCQCANPSSTNISSINEGDIQGESEDVFENTHGETDMSSSLGEEDDDENGAGRSSSANNANRSN